LCLHLKHHHDPSIYPSTFYPLLTFVRSVVKNMLSDCGRKFILKVFHLMKCISKRKVRTNVKHFERRGNQFACDRKCQLLLMKSWNFILFIFTVSLLADTLINVFLIFNWIEIIHVKSTEKYGSSSLKKREN
jgi:hypothetical protein